MLHITRVGEDTYLALDGTKEIGGCRFSAQGGRTVLEKLWLLDPRDLDVLDGLVRTAMFSGVDAGRENGQISQSVWESWKESFETLGFSQEFALADLPRCCQK